MTRESVHQVSGDEQAMEFKSMREQLAEVQHRINNPLAVVLGNVQFLLLKSDNLDEKLVKRLKVVEKAALKISEVNQQLSRLAKPESKNATANVDVSDDKAKVKA